MTFNIFKSAGSVSLRTVMNKPVIATMFGKRLHVTNKSNRNNLIMYFSTKRGSEKLRDLLTKTEFSFGITGASTMRERHAVYKKGNIEHHPLLSMNASFEEAEKYVKYHFYRVITHINKEFNIADSSEEKALFDSANHLLEMYQVVKGKGYERGRETSEEISNAYYGWILRREDYLQKMVVERVNEESIKRLAKAMHNIDVLASSIIGAM